MQDNKNLYDYTSEELKTKFLNDFEKKYSKYDYSEVNTKLDQHLRSEQYGQNIPKLYFLTKNLITLEEKENHSEHIVICPICRQRMRFEGYSKHFERCSSIEYLEIQAKKYDLKNFDKSGLRKMTQVEFDRIYDKVLEFVYRNSEDAEERKRIEVIFKSKTNPNLQVNIKELI
jgi:hypothetical protein